MYIKRINNVIGYKNLPDGFSVEFDENMNYILGANFQGKTTIGSLFNWCLTATSLYGKEKENVASDNKKVSKVLVDLSFVDNYGIEHRLIREKGKNMRLMLDGKEIKQDMLSEYYKDKEIFLAAYNPYYFYSLELKQQKDLLRKIVPTVSSEEAFELLDEFDQNIIKEPIENLNSYTESRNSEIAELEAEYNRNIGTMEAYKEIALNQEGEFLNFEKEQELEELTERLNSINTDFDGSNLTDLKQKIDRLSKNLDEILKVDLNNVKEKYIKELNKLENLKKDKPICPSCRQEIKDSEARNHLISFQIKEIDKLREKAEKLKDEAKEIAQNRNKKISIYNKLNNSDTDKIMQEKEYICSKIKELSEEKNNVILHNREVQVRKEQVGQAKEQIKLIETVQEEIKQTLDLCKNQRKVANKLKILVIEKQKEEIQKYLDKVEIQFSKIHSTTGEIAECLEIKYDGRDYKMLSKSQQARANLEICNLFNNLSGINAPIFFDDSESTTDINFFENTQMIISLVVKYNPLEIVYDFDDVLKRRKLALDKELKEYDNLFIQKAA